MTKESKGIVDPWRQVDPVHPKKERPKPVKEKIDISEIDLDADLAIPGTYIIRSEHASLKVTSVRVDTGSDALRIIAECILTLWTNKALAEALEDAGIGASCGRQSRNALSKETPHSLLKAEDASVWFVEQTIDEGMLRLCKVLRSPAAAPIVSRYGITVMLSG